MAWKKKRAAASKLSGRLAANKHQQRAAWRRNIEHGSGKIMA